MHGEKSRRFYIAVKGRILRVGGKLLSGGPR